jgi:hypothetical protein
MIEQFDLLSQVRNAAIEVPDRYWPETKDYKTLNSDGQIWARRNLIEQRREEIKFKAGYFYL